MIAAGAERCVWAIVPAAGSGRRFAAASPPSVPKQYARLCGRSVLEWTLGTLLAETRVRAIAVVLSKQDEHWPALARTLGSPRLLTAPGGADRQASVLSGIHCLSKHAAADDWVLVHDAARPCLSGRDLSGLLDALTADPRCQGAVLAAPIVDTMKRETGEGIETIDRQGLWRALTPQAFKFSQLRDALLAAAAERIAVTDEAQALERHGVRATLVPGSPFNIKITRAADLPVAAEILRMQNDEADSARRLRIGQGIDVHTFGAGDHVVLGGVSIPYTQGVVAHSDGDVIIHALCDALLGAMGDGDIGQHFPDTDPRYRGADSRVFLRSVAERVRDARFELVNADITVLAEAPRVNPHRAAMAVNLAADLGIDSRLVNIKATTTETLGFIGRREGLAAMASVLLGPAR